MTFANRKEVTSTGGTQQDYFVGGGPTPLSLDPLEELVADILEIKNGQIGCYNKHQIFAAANNTPAPAGKSERLA
ncbi:hypothetical protein O3P69_012081 [Scylla paramamosain]|uniref:Uncharacterized protein n=1 Tax=Scylla paramamosain TaxID=85552 RepID=A0AAW0TCF0_SCYPA